MAAIPSDILAPVLKLKRLAHGEGMDLPAYETAGSAGMDLRAAVEDGAPITLAPGARVLVPTGLILEIPEGFEAQIRPRSGLAFKNGVTCLNTPAHRQRLSRRGEGAAHQPRPGEFRHHPRHAHCPDGDRTGDAGAGHGSNGNERHGARCRRVRFDGRLRAADVRKADASGELLEDATAFQALSQLLQDVFGIDVCAADADGRTRSDLHAFWLLQ